jgi:hypothetical protein
MSSGFAIVVHMDNAWHLQNRTKESFTANRATNDRDAKVVRLEGHVAALEQRIREILDENFTLRRQIAEKSEKKAKR